jgi:mannose-1-phosphate guanylyltransferase
MRNTYVLIMAGGVGSRFWPKSRNNFPKQFIDILGLGKSLLQLTYERFSKICAPEHIYVLTNEQYINVIADQLPELRKDNIIAEPSRNNTAPCIAYASFKIADLDPDAKIVVAPSDHLILDENTFLEKIQAALDFAGETGALLTLGITPNRPDTGYGYINYERQGNNGVHKVSRFLEKPDLKKAIEFVSGGDYVWNAGIFIWKVSDILTALDKYAPEIYQLFLKGNGLYNTSAEREFIQENYPLSSNISIDYAVMEKAENVYTVPGEFGWSDLGTWASLYEVMDKDESNNVFTGYNASLPGTENCMIQLPKEKVAIIKGLSNYIIVDDGKVLLIYPKQNEQEIKEVSKGVVALCGVEFS